MIGVALEGVPIFRRGFGLAIVEHGTANTPATRMRIGSTTKHFTSLAALLLAEEDKLDIDAPLRTYLPELEGLTGEPCLRQLMQHTSGIRDPLDLTGFMLFGSWSTVLCAGAGLELSRRVRSANHAPGERMIYNNQGYYLLSLAIERVSGMPYASFLKQHVLAPLGMADTELLLSDMQMIPGIASFHMPQADGSYRRGIYPSEELLGSGGMISTVDDMLKWLSHLRSEKKSVGSAGSWESMLQKPRYSSGTLGDYCLGLIRENYRGVEIIHHAGAVFGCHLPDVDGAGASAGPHPDVQPHGCVRRGDCAQGGRLRARRQAGPRGAALEHGRPRKPDGPLVFSRLAPPVRRGRAAGAGAGAGVGAFHPGPGRRACCGKRIAA